MYKRSTQRQNKQVHSTSLSPAPRSSIPLKPKLSSINMKFISSAVLFLSVLAPAHAAPSVSAFKVRPASSSASAVSPARASSLLANTSNVSIYYCEHDNFKGDCIIMSEGDPSNLLVRGTCYNLGFMDQRISSFQASGGCCILYYFKGCSQAMIAADNRAWPILSETPYNDDARAWMCDLTCDNMPA